MQVRHKHTGKTQKMSKEDWEKLAETKHQENFEVVSKEDFTPAEAKTK